VHGGLSAGPRIAEGKARIAAAQRCGGPSQEFVEVATSESCERRSPDQLKRRRVNSWRAENGSNKTWSIIMVVSSGTS
jgi:hypothetical protein